VKSFLSPGFLMRGLQQIESSNGAIRPALFGDQNCRTHEITDTFPQGLTHTRSHAGPACGVGVLQACLLVLFLQRKAGSIVLHYHPDPCQAQRARLFFTDGDAFAVRSYSLTSRLQTRRILSLHTVDTAVLLPFWHWIWERFLGK
jgi:hypothetical protein